MQLEACIRRHGLHTGTIEDACYRQQAEAWWKAADSMLREPDAAQHLLSVLRKSQKGLQRDRDIVITLESRVRPLLQELQAYNLLTILYSGDRATTCFIPGGDCRAFLSGDWLEIALWHQLTVSGDYDEVRWSVRLVIHAQMEYELDVLALRNDELYLYACNTMADPVARSDVYLDLFQIYQKLFAGTPLHSFYVTVHPHVTELPGYPALATRAQRQGVGLITSNTQSKPLSRL